jgi:DNA polymerase
VSKLIAKMRQCLVAPTGQKLVVVDSAQIEARVNFYLAGQEDALDAFRNNRDIYSEFAARVFAAPCRKPKKNDSPLVARLFSTRRTLGKVGILGLGYGMGRVRLLEYMQTYPDLTPMIESGQIDEVFAADVVDKYRGTYQEVPRFWNSLENAFRKAVKYRQTTTLARGVSIWPDGSTGVIRLPSTRCLFYPHAKLSGIATRDRISFHWGPLWGGTICENVVQAVSRDILAEAVLKVEADGVPVVHHMHDEIVGMAPDNEAEAALATITKHLCAVPTWAPGLPLAAEGKISQRYEK